MTKKIAVYGSYEAKVPVQQRYWKRRKGGILQRYWKKTKRFKKSARSLFQRMMINRAILVVEVCGKGSNKAFSVSQKIFGLNIQLLKQFL